MRRSRSKSPVREKLLVDDEKSDGPTLIVEPDPEDMMHEKKIALKKSTPKLKKKVSQSHLLLPEYGTFSGGQTPKTNKRLSVGSELGSDDEIEFGAEPVLLYKKDAVKPEISNIECCVAKTTLILPFKWGESTIMDRGNNFHEIITLLLDRTVVDTKGDTLPLWNKKITSPRQARDLDPPFLKQLGLDGIQLSKSPHQMRASWFELNPTVLQLLFHDARLEAFTTSTAGIDSDDEDPNNIRQTDYAPHKAVCRFKFESVNLVVFYLGAALLMLNIDWCTESSTLLLENLPGWLYLAKFRHRVANIFNGWNFGSGEVDPEYYKNLPKEHCDSLGPHLCSTLYQNKPLSLSSLSNWLISKAEKGNKPKYMGYATRAYHHTVVVVRKKLKMDLLEKYLFLLRRANGQINRPSENGPTSVDRIIKLRQNRYIGISREGTASVSWLTKPDYTVELNWPKAFQGIYLILSIHVHGEKAILSELSNLISISGEHLEIVCSKATLNEMAQERKKLLSLMALMTRYTLQMSSDDCGGLSEYVEYFMAERKVFSINSQRKEITQEVRDVYNLVESTFYEEQRKVNSLDRLESEKSDRRKARFQNSITIVTSITLPVVLMSGIFGMNNDDLPPISFWTSMAVAGCISLVLLLVFLVWSFCSSQDEKQVKSLLFQKRQEIETLIIEDLRSVEKSSDEKKD